MRVLADGNLQGGPGGLGWRVPAGQALVVADVDWQYIHPQGAAEAGRIQVLLLFVENLATPIHTRRAFESAVTLSSRGDAGVSEAITTGFVVSSKARVCPDVFAGPQGPPFGLQHLILRGYLIS